MKIWLDGRLVDRDEAKLSVFDHGTLYGDGVFEGIRIYNGQIFQARAHLDRLFDSAAKIRLTIPYTKRQILDAMLSTIAANGQTDGYIRLVVTRGVGNLGLNPGKCPRAGVFIIADVIELFPPEMYETGMPVILAKTLRTSPRMVDPSVKSLNYLNNILAKIECADAGVAEALMLNEHGDIAEGTGDNVFIVERGRVITPPPSAGILLGVTRGVVMNLCRVNNIPVAEENVSPARLRDADECFLTGTAAEIISVSKVDDQLIGEGKTGPVTHQLMAAFHEFIRAEKPQYDV